MNIRDYLKERFSNFELVPSIYYQCDIGIHFSLGEDIYQFKGNDELNLERFQLVYKQTSTLLMNRLGI